MTKQPFMSSKEKVEAFIQISYWFQQPTGKCFWGARDLQHLTQRGG